ncbi:MAG: AI-2E family transporter [Eubacteriales bacterium]|nr:AI-2E family transporter [Eubacteriales bacterium]
MAADWLRSNRRRVTQVLLALGVILLMIFAWDALWSTLKPFLYALILAYLFNPVINFAQLKGVKRWISSLMLVLLILLLLLLFTLVLVPSIVRDAMELIRRLPAVVAGLREDMMDLLERLSTALAGSIDAKGTVDELTSGAYQVLMSMLTGLVSSLGGLVDFLLIPIIMFYMLKDKNFFIAEVRSWVKAGQWKSLQEMWRDINHVLSGFVRGRLILTLFVGIATGAGAAVLGIPNTITIGILAGVLDLIPYFGPWFGGVLPVVLALISDTPFTAVWMILWIVVVQQIESSVLSPKILSAEVGMHPLLVMFSVMFFGALFGVLGMIVGVPIMASTLALVRYFAEKAKKTVSDAFINPRV